MMWLGLICALLISVSCYTADSNPADEAAASKPLAELPIIGTEIPLLPPGPAREIAQVNCLACHSSEMIHQQRLTETQWKAELDKMQRWGAELRDEDKGALAQYLVSHFGPENDGFKPVVASP